MAKRDNQILGLCIGAAIALVALSGCSVRQMAINNLADALAGGGSVFASDNDPELIRDAAPFSLKLIESLLQETPRHRGLLLAAASGFTQYGFAFVQQDADRIEDEDISAALALRDRARKLYLRGRDYGLRGLEVRHKGIAAQLHSNPVAAVAAADRDDVPLMYWTACAWGAAIGISKDDPALIADQPAVEALIDRCLALDETFEDGAIHTYLITYEAVRQGATGDVSSRVRAQFERAVELSKGEVASPYVAFAEIDCVQRQDRDEFEAMLTKAIAIDIESRPQSRLENIIMQQRARWLLSRADDLFVE